MVALALLLVVMSDDTNGGNLSPKDPRPFFGVRLTAECSLSNDRGRVDSANAVNAVLGMELVGYTLPLVVDGTTLSLLGSVDLIRPLRGLPDGLGTGLTLRERGVTKLPIREPACC